jgi:hypothetical protein
MRRGGAGLMLAAGLIMAAQGCTGSTAAAPTASTTPALTISEAQQAFTAFVTADGIARASGDEWLEASAVSYGQVALATAAYQTADFTGQSVPRYGYGKPRFYVPRLKGYPLWFITVVQRAPLGGGPAQTAIMVFDKRSPAEDFTLASVSLLGPGYTMPDIFVDSSGYATPLATSDAQLPVSPDAVGALQATVAQDGPHSAATAAIAPGPYTTGVHSQIIAATQQTEAQGYNYQALLSGSSDPVFALETASGGALVTYTMNLYSVTLRTNPPVRQIEIPPAYAPLLNGGLVVQYELDTGATDQYAAVIPPDSKNERPVNVIAFDGAPTVADGHLWSLAEEPGRTRGVASGLCHLWALDIADAFLNHLDHLVVPSSDVEGFLHEQEPGNAGHEQDKLQRRVILRRDSVILEDHGYRVNLHLTKPLRILGDLALNRFAVIGQGDKFHSQRAMRLITYQLPKPPERLVGGQRLSLPLETLVGTSLEQRDEQLVHRAEIVIDKSRIRARPVGYSPGANRCVPFFHHDLQGRVEEGCAGP